MRAVAYSIRSFEKEPLAKANRKKHEITLISNPLGLETAQYASGKEVVIISVDDFLSEAIIDKLATLGVKYIAVRGESTANIDKAAAGRNNLEIATIKYPASNPATGPEFIRHHYEIASNTIDNLDSWKEAMNNGHEASFNSFF